MPEVDPIQTNFTSGEISPLGYGRTDIPQYKNGAKELTNFLIDPKGPAEFRGGFEYIIDSSAPSISSPSRLFDFVPTSDASYIIEVGHNFCNVYNEAGTLKLNQTANVWDGSDIWDITVETESNEMYFYHPRYKTRQLVRTDDTTWAWSLREFENGPYVTTDRNNIQLSVDNFVYRVQIDSAFGGDFGSVGVGDFIEWQVGGDWYLGEVFSRPTTEQIIAEPVSYIIRDAVFDLAPQRNAPSTGKLGSRIAGFSALFEKAYYRMTDATDGKKSWVKGDFYEGTTGSTTLYDTVALADLGSSQYYISHDTGVANNYKPLFSLDSPIGATQLSGPLTVTDSVNTADLTASAALFDAGTAASRDIDRWVLLVLGSQTLNVKITYDASNTSTQVKVEPSSAPPRAPGSENIANSGNTEIWFLGAFFGSDGTASASYPFSGEGYQQRQMLTGSPEFPDYIFSSVTGEKNDFSPLTADAEVLATSGISYKVKADRTPIVRTITAKDDLLIGTETGLQRGRSPSDGDPITPTNLRVTPEESKGTIIPPILIGTDLLYIQRSGRRVNQVGFNIRVNGYEAQDTTILADHIFEKDGTEAVDFAYKQEPISTLWVARQDGRLACLTYEKQQDVYAWTQHTLGGRTLTSGDMLTNGAWYRIKANTTDFTTYGAATNDKYTVFQSTGIPTLSGDDEVEEVGFVESIVTIPSTDKKEDWLYALVQRGDQKTIERLVSPFRPSHPQDKESMVFLDSATTVDLGGTPTTVVTDASLARFNGKTVSVVADGAIQPDVAVSGNSFTLQQSASDYVHVGWKYTGIIRPLEINVEGIAGTNQGKRRMTHALTVRVRNSLGFKYGISLDELDLEEFSETTRTMNIGPDLVSDDRRVEFRSGWDRKSELYIVQDLPYPLTVVSLMPEINQSR
jgi:hypothetical protein